MLGNADKQDSEDVVRVRELVDEARRYDSADVALFKARKAAEAICRQVLEREEGEGAPNAAYDQLVARVTKIKKEGRPIISRLIETELRVIQLYGNLGVHDQGDAAVAGASQATACLAALGEVARWFADDYVGHAGKSKEQRRRRRAIADAVVPRLKHPRKLLVEEIERLRMDLDARHPTACVLVSQQIAAQISARICEREGLLVEEDGGLDHLLERAAFAERMRKGSCPDRIWSEMKQIGGYGELARVAHQPEERHPESSDAQVCIEAVGRLVSWYRDTYLRDGQLVPIRHALLLRLLVFGLFAAGAAIVLLRLRLR